MWDPWPSELARHCRRALPLPPPKLLPNWIYVTTVGIRRIPVKITKNVSPGMEHTVSCKIQPNLAKGGVEVGGARRRWWWGDRWGDESHMISFKRFKEDYLWGFGQNPNSRLVLTLNTVSIWNNDESMISFSLPTWGIFIVVQIDIHTQMTLFTP